MLLDGGGGVFLRVESRAARPGSWMQEPAKAAKERAVDAIGPESWERPADDFEQLRAPLDRLPPAARRARVPAMTRCSRCQYRKYHLMLAISMEAAPAATRLRRLFGTPRAREFRACLKGPKTGTAKTQRNDAVFLDASADQSASSGRRRHMRTMRAAHG